MNRTPNTPANGGQILTDRDLLVKRAHEAGFGVIGNFVMPPNHAGHMTEELEHFAATIEAELRASLAAPAIPTVDRNAAIMRQALIDMQNPIIAMQREVPEGSVLNPHIAMQMASEPEWYKRHAQEALDKCATPATVKTAEDL